MQDGFRKKEGIELTRHLSEQIGAIAGLETSDLMRPAVFFDRDGVLNEDDGYVFEPNALRWVSGASPLRTAETRPKVETNAEPI